MSRREIAVLLRAGVQRRSMKAVLCGGLSSRLHRTVATTWSAMAARLSLWQMHQEDSSFRPHPPEVEYLPVRLCQADAVRGRQ